MFGMKGGGEIVAIADLESGSAAIAIIETGDSPRILSLQREVLPLESRSLTALASGVTGALSSASEKALEHLATEAPGKRVSRCFCIVGSPWSHSYAGEASFSFEKESVISEAMISKLGKDALANQKEVPRENLLEASVTRVLLNGYPTEKPAGKRAHDIRIFTLISDCDFRVKQGAQESLAKFFPDAPVSWRSSARALLAILRSSGSPASVLIANVGAEATDLIAVRKGVLEGRALIKSGVRQIAETLVKGRPPEETVALIDRVERDQCEESQCEMLKQSIAEKEPELAHQFGESLAKLSAERKLPDSLVLIAPAPLSGYLSRFFARIDFTQFTATARPFSVSTSPSLPIVSSDPRISADPGLCIGCMLANIELSI